MLFVAAASAGAAPETSHEYRIGAGDVLSVEVLGHPELSCAPAVQADGHIRLPDGSEIPVLELTPDEVAGSVAARLGSVRRADVQVGVSEYRSRFVRVEGAVNRPGRVALRGGTRLVDALVEAGGFSPGASGEVVILRRGGTDGEPPRRIAIQVGPDLEGRSLVDLGLPLEHGDRIAALLQQQVAVGGAVRRPGHYPLTEAPTLLSALAAAGGSSSAKGKVELSRAGGGTEELDLEAIRRGEQPDPVLAGGDAVAVK